MKKNRERGATLALIVACSLVLVFIGFTFFWLSQLLGGGSELQHSTDSGNLNVAKQALRSPNLNVFGAGPSHDIADAATLAEIQKNFSDLQDPQNGQVDLLVYDRLVAQALIVALNAADEGTTQATANAQSVINLLTDPNNGIGPNLTKKLSSDSALDTNFTNLTSLANLRMLKAGSSEADTSSGKEVSYMLAPTGGNINAGNVYFNNINSIPASQRTNFLANFTVQKTFGSADPNPGTFNYLSGYAPLNIAGITTTPANTLMAVPLRPHQRPHIVDGTDFDNAKTSPLAITNGVANSAVPPNAFKAAGTGVDARTLGNVSAISCAIAGVVSATNGNGDYQAAIPGGVIAVANGYGTDPTASPGPVAFSPSNQTLGAINPPGTTSVDIFSGVLMSGVFISASPISQAVSAVPGCITQLEKDALQYLISRNYLNYLESVGPDSECLLGPYKRSDALSMLNIVTSDAQNGITPSTLGYVDGNTGQVTNDETACTDVTVFDGSQPACTAAYYSGSGYLVLRLGGNLPNNSSNPSTLTNVSAIDLVKSQVINARASGSGVTVTLPGGGISMYSGMTAFPLSSYLNVGQSAAGGALPPPSLNSLIGGSGNFTGYGPTSAGATTAYNQIIQRMQEIKPSMQLTDTDVTAVLNTALPQSTTMYIWMDGHQNFQMTNSAAYTSDTTLPYHIDLTQLQADGASLTTTTGGISMVGTYVDLSSEGGYPHPYDCTPSSPGTASATFVWTPSTGKDCLLGIMRFYNYVDLGTTSYTFNCPC